ncbi:hypothetical protein BGW80DRAFT_1301546 [Lactifluus volemus]|nr:hypothetical protein BGW80DRAFT_1301546 [Lactifluus volemus]
MHAAVNEPPHGIVAVLEPTLNRATGIRYSTHQSDDIALEHKVEASTCAQDIIISGGAHTPSLCDANAWDPKRTQPQYAQPQETTPFRVGTKEGNIYQAKRYDRAGAIASLDQ